MKKILELQNVKSSFFTHLGEVQAVRGVSFGLDHGEALGIVGESGSGKSVTSLSVMRLLQNPGKIKSGQIIFKGENLPDKNKAEMMAIRGNEIAMIFQDPMTSLNPVYTIGDQISEVLRAHRKLNKKEAWEKVLEMLCLVGIPSPERRLNNYPHEFSGGMRQRVMIAIALACQPELLIADEPTTALDVTIQAQILRLMKGLKKKLDTSIILITHDLGIVADLCTRVIVMYGGLIMEEASVRDIFYRPKHPYTMGLLNSIPQVTEEKRLVPILGSPPDLLRPPEGCPFAARCKYAMKICREKQPPYYSAGEGHRSLCWLLDQEAPASDLKPAGSKGGEVQEPVSAL